MRRHRLLGIVLAGALAVLPAAAARADTKIASSNSTEGTETSSGDASATNSGTAQVGHSGGGSVQDGTSSAESEDVSGADITNNQATNVQEGDNELDVSQDATAVSGDTVGGQVIGAVTDGTLDIDATNLSRDVDLESGDADATNDLAAFVGLMAGSATALGADDISNLSADNVQVGDNSSNVLQDTDAATGDAVGGQIVGGRSGGPSDIVASNTSEDTDASSGDADESSDIGQFTGLHASGVIQLT